MASYTLGKKDIQKQAWHLAVNGKNRQQVFDELIPRFRGRELDIAEILANMSFPEEEKKWGWVYLAMKVLVIACIIATALLPLYYLFTFYFFGFCMMPLLLLNGFILYALHYRIRPIVSNFYIWSITLFLFGANAIAQPGEEMQLIGIAFISLIGFVLSRIAKKNLFGSYKHTAVQKRSQNGQIIAVSKIRFLN